jgi:tRNA(Ile)-lysidine synthase
MKSADDHSSRYAPLSAADFAARLVALDAGPHVGVAFSGGGDSLALLVLAAQWAKRSKARTLIAYTVDHGLRADAAAEAKQCARVAASLGVPHRILRWVGDKPRSDIQAAARDARYSLLADACKKDGVSSLLVAHHLEDQAETFLLRLARGSGVDGLAGMAARRPLDAEGKVYLLRPLLDFPRERLRAVVTRSGLSAIEDPSNSNAKFDRVKARQLMSELSTLGLTPQRLADTASHMARAREALSGEARQWLRAHACLLPTGLVDADAAALLSAPDEIALRVLSEILKQVGAQNYPPRFEALSALHAALRAGDLHKARTLHGARVLVRAGRFIAMREASAALKAAPLSIVLGESGIWDGRFNVCLTRSPRRVRDLQVRALGADGLRQLRQLGLSEPEGPKAMLPSLPALWQGERLVAAPHFGTEPIGVDPDYGLSVEIWRGGAFAESLGRS